MAHNLVCPRCGTPAAPDRDCANCGLSLGQQQLPTREAWERQVLAAAHEFVQETEPRGARLPSRIWFLLAAILIGAIATAALLFSSSDSPTDSRKQQPAAASGSVEELSAGNLDICTERWNGDRRILEGGYAKGAETALVIRDADGRCVIALPARAAGRSGFVTFVRVESGNWGSYANNPPVGEGLYATDKALARAKGWERTATEAPNAAVRKNGTITIERN